MTIPATIITRGFGVDKGNSITRGYGGLLATVVGITKKAGSAPGVHSEPVRRLLEEWRVTATLDEIDGIELTFIVRGTDRSKFDTRTKFMLNAEITAEQLREYLFQSRLTGIDGKMENVQVDVGSVEVTGTSIPVVRIRNLELNTEE